MEMENSHGKKAVWREILEARYENLKLKVLIGDVSVVKKMIQYDGETYSYRIIMRN